MLEAKQKEEEKRKKESEMETESIGSDSNQGKEAEFEWNIITKKLHQNVLYNFRNYVPLELCRV